jgi:hypothetical protein
MTIKPPAPPPLPDELDRLLRRLRLPYVRRAAPEVIATATTQRWEHSEVLRVLLTEEAAGRDRRAAPAPRPRDHHRRPRQLPACASDRRQGSDAPGLKSPTHPPVGRNDGHQ